jgi:hypothetical protein
MSIEGAFRDQLLADSKVSTALGTRVYPNFAPTSADKPYAVYSIEDHEFIEYMTAPISVATVDIELRLYSLSAVERDVISTNIRMAIERFDGPMGLYSVNVRRCKLTRGPLTDVIPPTANDQRGIFTAVMTFSITYRVEIPTRPIIVKAAP